MRCPDLLAAVVLPSLLALPSCEVTIDAGRDFPAGSELIVPVDDPAPSPSPAPVIAVGCTTLAAAIGDAEDCTLEVSHSGTGDRVLLGWALNDGGGVFSVLSAFDPPRLLREGAAATVAVRATFPRQGLVRSSFVVSIDDPQTPTIRFPLVGFGLDETTLLVQLAWSTASGDFDLHVMRADGAGQFCAGGSDQVRAAVQTTAALAMACADGTQNDCSRLGCDGAQLDWDDTGDPSAGDPVIDLLDGDGEGPELISVPAVAAGRYLVAIHRARPPHPPAHATVRTFYRGALLGEVSVTAERDWLEAGVIEVGSSSCFPASAAGCP
jgi:hypothetical protein